MWRRCTYTGYKDCEFAFGLGIVGVAELPDNHLCVLAKIDEIEVEELIVFMEEYSRQIGLKISLRCFHQTDSLAAGQFEGARDVIYLEDGRFVCLFQDAIGVFDFNGGNWTKNTYLNAFA